jgi:hypothetical protein
MFLPPFCLTDIILKVKNPALQDSPPAARRFSDKIPLRRSAILPEGFLLYGKMQIIFLYNKKHATRHG